MDGQNVLNQTKQIDNELKPLPLSDDFSVAPF